MKNLVALGVLLITLNVDAHELPESNTHGHDSYIAYAMKFGRVNEAGLPLHEFHFGWYVTPDRFAGVSIYGGDSHIRNTEYKFGYAGLNYGVIRRAARNSYYKAGIMLGAGGVEHGAHRAVDRVLVAEPGATFGFNVSQRSSLQFGVAHRIVALAQGRDTSNEDLSGFTFNVGFQYQIDESHRK